MGNWSPDTTDVQVLNRTVRELRKRIHHKVVQIWLYEDSWETLKMMKPDEFQFFILMIMLFLKKDNGLIEMRRDDQRLLIEKFGISRPTLYRKLKKCIEADVLTRVERSVYLVNSNIITIGKDKQAMRSVNSQPAIKN